MAREKVHIQRDAIEEFLMSAKDYFKKYRRYFLIIISVTGILLVLGVSFAAYSEIRAKGDLEKFETILDEYDKNKNDEKKKEAAFKTAIDKLIALTDSSISGYVNEYGYYQIAGFFYNEKKYKEARDYYLKFTDSSSNLFVPLALRKAAICEEWLNNNDGALKLYQKIEKEYENFAFTAQNVYDIARMYQKKGDIKKAKEYFKKVLKSDQYSIYGKRAQTRLFSLGLGK